MQVNLLNAALVAAGALLFPALHAQSSVTTTYAAGNSGSSTWTNQFDVTVLANPLLVTAFDVNCENTRSGGVGSPFTLDVWITALGGTYVGNETNASVWTKVSTGTGVSRAMGTPTPVDVADFLLLPGRYGMALEYNGTAMAYTNGTGSNQSYANADVRLDLGSSTTGRFAAPIYTPRVWNGTLYYFAGNGTSRAYGAGCAGSAGVPVLKPGPSSTPKLGAIFVIDQTNLPAATPAYLAIGFSNTTWQGVPLPADLTPIGAPGCKLFAAANVLLGGASVSGTATFMLPIPNSPSLFGGVVYLQGLSMQTSANTLGLVFSNALEAYLGN